MGEIDQLAEEVKLKNTLMKVLFVHPLMEGWGPLLEDFFHSISSSRVKIRADSFFRQIQVRVRCKILVGLILSGLASTPICSSG
jgi:hypothetical protein